MLRNCNKLAFVRFFSDLNLNGSTPLRAQPRVGEWGPVMVPSTRWKKWTRVLVPLIAVGLAVGVFFLARTFYLMLTGDEAGAYFSEVTAFNTSGQVRSSCRPPKEINPRAARRPRTGPTGRNNQPSSGKR